VISGQRHAVVMDELADLMPCTALPGARTVTVVDTKLADAAARLLARVARARTGHRVDR
jgi:hypothetical protein